MAESATDPRLGAVLQGRYKIHSRIAAGGMGVVYRGERVPFGRAVAIKFLHAPLAADKEFLRRFDLEARAMSRLGHPHCVSVIDFGVDDGAPYMVLELAQGKTLREIMDAGAMPPQRALHITRQLLAGLAHAHGQGIVHRDIKPANIMLGEATGTGDHVRILDFGLAKLRDIGSADVSTVQIAVGTPSYMAPEQGLGKRVDARSDVYSTGVLLFELLTGQKPFVADETVDLLEMHRETPAPLLRVVAPERGFSAALEAVLQKAMAKAPDERFQTAAEMMDALAASPESGRPTTLPPGTVPAPGNEATIPLDSLVDKLEKSESPALLPVLSPREQALALGDKEGGGKGRLTLALLVLLLFAGAGAAYLKFGRGTGKTSTSTSTMPSTSPMPSASPSTSASPTPTDGEPAWSVGPGAGVVDAGVGADAEVMAAVGEDEPDPDGDGGTEVPVLGDVPPEEQGDPVAAVPEDIVIDDTQIDEPEPSPSEPPKVAPATTVDGALALIKAGKKLEAIQSLQRLARQNPKSAYIPYLLGNLYFERRWWTQGLDAYRAAVANDRRYAARATLNRNAIRALAADKTRVRASNLIRKVIGRSALPFLRSAARSDRNRDVRARADALARAMTPKKKK